MDASATPWWEREPEASSQEDRSRDARVLIAQMCVSLGFHFAGRIPYLFDTSRQATAKRYEVVRELLGVINQQPTGREGVFEVVTSSCVLDEKLIPPSVGTEIIRLLKKDGTPSKRYVYGWAVANEWRPEESGGAA